MTKPIEPGTTPEMWTAAMIAGQYVTKLNPDQLKRLEGEIITALREAQAPLLKRVEELQKDYDNLKEAYYGSTPEPFMGRITELESTVISLREALGQVRGEIKASREYPVIYIGNPLDHVNDIATEALTATTPQTNAIRERIRGEVVEECVAVIQKRIDGIDAIERGAFNGNLTDKAIYTRKAWKVVRKAIQSIKKGGTL